MVSVSNFFVSVEKSVLNEIVKLGFKKMEFNFKNLSKKK
jgi:hypothetical protein